VVVCAVRYELVSLLFAQYQGDFRKKTANRWAKIPKTTAAQAFLEHRANSISRRNRERQISTTPSEHLTNWKGAFGRLVLGIPTWIDPVAKRSKLS
jgi:hypothetical protein